MIEIIEADGQQKDVASTVEKMDTGLVTALMKVDETNASIVENKATPPEIAKKDEEMEVLEDFIHTMTIIVIDEVEDLEVDQNHPVRTRDPDQDPILMKENPNQEEDPEIEDLHPQKKNTNKFPNHLKELRDHQENLEAQLLQNHNILLFA